MYFYYNGTFFPQNECQIVIRKQALFNQRGQRERTREIWDVSGYRQSTSQAALTTSLASLQTVLAVNGGDVGLYLDDQSTLTTHYMVNALTANGTRVTNLNFPRGEGAEYSNGNPNYRSYSFSIEADFLDLSNSLLEFAELITFSGNGGPSIIYLPVLQGPPQGQQVTQQTTYRAIQQGRATGLLGWPGVPGPIWPDAEIGPLREISPQSPSIIGNFPNQFVIAWKYVFESSYPLIGIPHIA